MIIKELWGEYKAIDSTWKKIALAIPLALGAVVLLGVLLYKKVIFEDKTLVDEMIEADDEQIKKSEDKVKELEKETKELEAERKKLKEEMKENAEETRELDHRIDNANDMYELERIRRELCNRRKNSTQ